MRKGVAILLAVLLVLASVSFAAADETAAMLLQNLTDFLLIFGHYAEILS